MREVDHELSQRILILIHERGGRDVNITPSDFDLSDTGSDIQVYRLTVRHLEGVGEISVKFMSLGGAVVASLVRD